MSCQWTSPDDYKWNPKQWNQVDTTNATPPEVVGTNALNSSPTDAAYQQLVTGATSTACAWKAACQAVSDDPDTCMKQCPVALGIAWNESKFLPIAQSYDGIGRGLFQFGGSYSPSCVRGFRGHDCDISFDNGINLDYNKGAGIDATVEDCDAYNPIRSAIKAVELTNNGLYWRPTGNVWNSCNTDGTIKEFATIQEIAQSACTKVGITEQTDDVTCMKGSDTGKDLQPCDICSNCNNLFNNEIADYCKPKNQCPLDLNQQFCMGTCRSCTEKQANGQFCGGFVDGYCEDVVKCDKGDKDTGLCSNSIQMKCTSDDDCGDLICEDGHTCVDYIMGMGPTCVTLEEAEKNSVAGVKKG